MQYSTETGVQASVAGQRQATAVGGAWLPILQVKGPDNGGSGTKNNGGNSGGKDVSKLLPVFAIAFSRADDCVRSLGLLGDGGSEEGMGWEGKGELEGFCDCWWGFRHPASAL